MPAEDISPSRGAIAEPASSSRGLRNAPFAPLLAGPDGSPRRPVVLVAEDDARLAGVLWRALSRSGYEVISTDDGLRALEAVAAATPDLALVDVGLPGLNGRVVCRQLRESEGTPPVILMSANCSELDRRAALSAGADVFLAKPFALVEMLTEVARLITPRS